MEELNNIVSNIKYTQDQKKHKNYGDRIVTNAGVFFRDENISIDTYKKIVCMKVYGKIMEKLKFESFVNLEVLDISSVNFTKQISPFVSIFNKINGEEEKEKILDSELLEINSLKKLQILKIILKTDREILGTKRIKGDYSFLNCLPSSVTTLVVVGLSNTLVNELNFSNVPSTVQKIELHKHAINKSNLLKNMVIEQLKKYKYPFGCKIYLDDVELEL